jgi:hypothetical protein
MANHLMSGYSPPTSLALLTHLAQTMEQFGPGAMIEESFHSSAGILYPDPIGAESHLRPLPVLEHPVLRDGLLATILRQPQQLRGRAGAPIFAAPCWDILRRYGPFPFGCTRQPLGACYDVAPGELHGECSWNRSSILSKT